MKEISEGAAFLLTVGGPVILFFALLVIVANLIDWFREVRGGKK